MISRSSTRASKAPNRDSVEVLELAAHPGGVLRAIAARRAFSNITSIQAYCRAFLVRRALHLNRDHHSSSRAKTASVFPTSVTVERSTSTSKKSSALISKYDGPEHAIVRLSLSIKDTTKASSDFRKLIEDKRCRLASVTSRSKALEKHVSDLRTRKHDESVPVELYESLKADLLSVEGQIRSLNEQEVQQQDQLTTLRSRLQEAAQAREALWQNAQTPAGLDAIDSYEKEKHLSDAVGRANEYLKMMTARQNAASQSRQASSSTSDTKSPTFVALDRSSRSPLAPHSRPARAKPPSSFRGPRTPLTSLSLADTLKVGASPSSASVRSSTTACSIVRRRLSISAEEVQKSREEVNARLLEFYNPTRPKMQPVPPQPIAIPPVPASAVLVERDQNRPSRPSSDDDPFWSPFTPASNLTLDLKLPKPARVPAVRIQTSTASDRRGRKSKRLSAPASAMKPLNTPSAELRVEQPPSPALTPRRAAMRRMARIIRQQNNEQPDEETVESDDGELDFACKGRRSSSLARSSMTGLGRRFGHRRGLSSMSRMFTPTARTDLDRSMTHESSTGTGREWIANLLTNKSDLSTNMSLDLALQIDGFAPNAVQKHSSPSMTDRVEWDVVDTHDYVGRPSFHRIPSPRPRLRMEWVSHDVDAQSALDERVVVDGEEDIPLEDTVISQFEWQLAEGALPMSERRMSWRLAKRASGIFSGLALPDANVDDESGGTGEGRPQRHNRFSVASVLTQRSSRRGSTLPTPL